MVDLAGSLVAIVTPFRDGAVDLDAFGDLVDWQIQSGTRGIVVCGTTGEAATLRVEERQALLRRAVDVTNRRCPVVYGSGTNATWASIEHTRAAVALGADALLVVTPYYNKPNQAGLEQHFREVAKSASGRPVVLYDVPGRTGVTIAEDTVRRLAEVPNITAIKDATHDVERAGRIVRETSLTVLSGDDGQTLPLMRVGARGVISVAANVVPEQMARLCAEQDIELHEALGGLFKALFIDTNPIPLKFALAHLGRIRNELRLPLVALDRQYEGPVLDALRAAQAL